ncbi:hypothetical protein ECC40_04135 [Helicobacter pylori]|nr:hypothetical protein ECC40_04135 [Helicobacter pylori]
MQSFSPKTQGFACKSGVVLEFWSVCMRLLKMIARLVRDAYSFKQGFERSLKLNQRFVKTKPNPLHRLVLGA